MAAELVQSLLAQADVFMQDLLAFEPTLRAMAMRYTHEASLAQDLVQDTIVRAIRYRSQFASDGHFKAWMATILAHTFINGYRRRKREQACLTGTSATDLRNALQDEASREKAQNPEASLGARVLRGQVAQALAKLPEAYREVVQLCDLQDMRYSDAAHELDIPMGTVMSRLHRGRKMLKDLLSAQETVVA